MQTEDDGPDPFDTAAWRRLIDDQTLSSVRIESAVAAVQKIGPHGDKRVLDGLMKCISDRMIQILRRTIGRNHRNEGYDMIEEAHSQLIEAVLKPQSADGAALRVAFRARVEHRAADAIRREQLNADRYRYSEDEGVLPPPEQRPWSADEEHAHVEGVLLKIDDPRKRLAFRLHMDGIPRSSKKVESIATALGVSAKTAETWIKETAEEVKNMLGV